MKDKDMLLREAKKNDCRDIWLWRNHPDIRKNFFDTNPVKWKDHVKWFSLKLKEPATKIYIAEVGGDRAGIIRFEKKEGSAKVSVNLNPRFFGRGLGSGIIKAGTERYSKEMPGKRPIIAVIKDDNIVSQKAFEKAGYKFTRREDKKMIFQVRGKEMRIYGKRIYLRPLEKKDINKRYLSWLKDPDTMRFIESRAHSHTINALSEYYNKVIKSGKDFIFAIVTNNKDVHIGNIKLGNVNLVHRYGDLGIMIGEKKYRGKGYGQEACRLLLKYAFECLRLNKVILGVYATHRPAISAYKNAGFKIEGRIKKLLNLEGKFVDKVIMGITSADFKRICQDGIK